jgi:hypothetical protein
MSATFNLSTVIPLDAAHAGSLVRVEPLIAGLALLIDIRAGVVGLGVFPTYHLTVRKSGGKSTESRNTKTSLTTGTVATAPCVWTSTSCAPSGATPTISRDGRTPGWGWNGVMVMLAMPCSTASEVGAHVVPTPLLSCATTHR